MRLWSLDPRYLDARGLVALWREGLLAQAVLRGRTRGYRNHPQLERFRAHERPLGCIGSYLHAVRAEGLSRGYAFAARIGPSRIDGRLPVSRGQLEYEWRRLLQKLAVRDPAWLSKLESVERRLPHPLFRVVPGGVERWERVARVA